MMASSSMGCRRCVAVGPLKPYTLNVKPRNPEPSILLVHYEQTV